VVDVCDVVGVVQDVHSQGWLWQGGAMYMRVITKLHLKYVPASMHLWLMQLHCDHHHSAQASAACSSTHDLSHCSINSINSMIKHSSTLQSQAACCVLSLSQVNSINNINSIDSMNKHSSHLQGYCVTWLMPILEFHDAIQQTKQHQH
jgi:hypothetical protein